MKTPLSVIVVRQGSLADSEPFVSALRKTFLGTDLTDSYTAADYELLNPVDFRVFSPLAKARDPNGAALLPSSEKDAIARCSENVLIVLLLASGSSEATATLAKWAQFADTHRNTRLLAFSLASPKAISLPTGALSDRVSSFGLDDLDERDLRRDFLALFAANAAVALLTPEAASAGHKPTIFFSHAKRDGVPLSTALVSWMTRLKGFHSFYDTKDLDLAGDLSSQLETAIKSSVLVVLRTEVFDQRYWCQEEVFWAEKHGVPVIAVDARWSVKVAPSVITLDSSPSVRIPDGSLVRILQAATEEALRVGLHTARANLIARNAKLPKDSWFVMPRQPSLVSFEMAAKASRKRSGSSGPLPFLVVYSNPALPDGLRDSAAYVCNALISNARLLSLDEFRVYCLTGVP